MCYSTRSSLIAWGISAAIGVYLWYRNGKYDRWNAAFILTFSLVQLWEGLIWSSPGPEYTNVYLKLLLIGLMAQPLVQTIGAWKYTGSNVLKYMMYFYFALWAFMIYRALTHSFYATVGPSGHLIWNIDDGTHFVSGWYFPLIMILYLIGLFGGLFWALPNTFPLIFIGIATLLWSLSKVSVNEVSSYWCYTAVIYSVVTLFI